MAYKITKDKFIKSVKTEGKKRYHDKHPFNSLLYSGKLTEHQLQGWIINWFYYQKNISRRDASIISNCPVSDVRRLWMNRIINHDGYGEVEGGIEGWIRFAESAGIERDVLLSSECLPGVRLAVDSLLSFVKNCNWLDGVATSLGQIFLPAAIDKRINALSKHYSDVVSPDGLRYFMSLMAQAKNDSNTSINLIVKYSSSKQDELSILQSLFFAEDVVWTILDSVYSHYVVQSPE